MKNWVFPLLVMIVALSLAVYRYRNLSETKAPHSAGFEIPTETDAGSGAGAVQSKKTSRRSRGPN